MASYLKPCNLVNMYELHGVTSQALQFGTHVRTTLRHISRHAIWYTCTNYMASLLKTIVMFRPPPRETELSFYWRLKNLTTTIRDLRSSGKWRCVTESRNVRQHSPTDAALRPLRTKTSTAPLRKPKTRTEFITVIQLETPWDENGRKRNAKTN